MLRVCYVSPTYFAAESVLGGGERFAEELARAMARQADAVASVKFLSFGARELRERPAARLERVILASWTRSKFAPLSPRLFGELAGFDVLHCLQYHALPTFLACLAGGVSGRRVFVSDLGGGGWTPGYHIDASRWISAHLPISAYAARSLPGRHRRHRVIYGGVDLARYPMRPAAAHDGSLVFLGRLLPHKGIHHLIAGLPAGRALHIVGSEGSATYRARLEEAARGQAVHFHSGLGDDAVIALLGRAMALVHPTPVDDRGDAGAHELFGLALVEAMACGCPVIASRAASLPEIVEDGVQGLLVPPNDPAALGDAIERLAAEPELWARLSLAARRRVEERFTWEQVARRCLAAYGASFEDGGGEASP